jgi:hypothetical protein
MRLNRCVIVRAANVATTGGRNGKGGHWMKRFFIFSILPLLLMIAAPVYAEINTLTWQDNANNEDGYGIYRSVGFEDFILIATTGPDVTTWSENFPEINVPQSVCYAVDAFNTAARSDKTETKCKLVPACEQKGKSGRCR